MQQQREQGSDGIAKEKLLTRLLTKPLGSVGYDVDGDGIVSLSPTSSGWSLVACPGIATPDYAAVWEGYIDLQGMTVAQDLSLAIRSVDIQESDIVGGNADLLMIWDVVSDVPIDWELELADTGVSGRRSPFPGQKGSFRNMENIIRGRMRLYVKNTTIPVAMMLLQETSWGANRATASDRLYLYRVVHGGATTGASDSQIPPATFVMPVIFFEEKDLEHMERLRRSYILQQ